MGVHETKTFRSGKGVALPLPRSLAVDPGERMLIEQQGSRLTVRRASHRAETVRKLRSLLGALEIIGRRRPPR
jgi:virulence-associated protein VagC